MGRGYSRQPSQQRVRGGDAVGLGSAKGGHPHRQQRLPRAVNGHARSGTDRAGRGTRRDGSRFLMRGPFLFGVRDGAFAWLLCYLEPVDAAAVAEGKR
jgi:hypothetical protein